MWIYHSHQVNPSHEQGAHPAEHADHKEQGAADGLVTVIGHHCQQKRFRIYRDTEDKELQSTATEGDRLVLGKLVHQHLGNNCCGIAEVTEGEVAKAKYMDVCSWGSFVIRVIIPRFARRLIR